MTTNVIFMSILIVDTDKHKARHVSFQPGLNVITSSENHVGKSSLTKSLYFSLGAEIDYDPHWDKKTKIYCLEFLVDGKPFTIVRQKSNFLIFSGVDLIAECTSISKELAPKLEEIFGFSVYLPDKNTKNMYSRRLSLHTYHTTSIRIWVGGQNLMKALPASTSS